MVQTYSLPSALFPQAVQVHQFSPDPPGEQVTTENYSKKAGEKGFIFDVLQSVLYVLFISFSGNIFQHKTAQF